MKRSLIPALSSLLLASTPAFAAPGDLDTTFNSTGKITTTIGGSDDRANAIELQSDGKIIVVGSAKIGAGNDIAIVRYNTNGSLDTSFNTTGKVTTAIGSGEDFAQAVAVQSDGKIVIAGYADVGSFNNDIAVVRYNANGSLDTTFNTTGKVTTPIGSGDDRGYGVAIQSDSKIVVAGFSYNGTNNDFAVVRYNANGSLDTTFNTTGKVITPIGTGEDIGFQMALQSDGKILVCGYSRATNYDFAVVRYNTNGSLDTTFNTTGKVVTPVGSSNDFGTGMALQSDGKILLTGYGSNGTNDDVMLVRYNTNGSLDTTFNTTGKVITPIGTSESGRFVRVQSDGKPVVAAITDNDIAIVRYTSAGALDTTFGTTGKVKIDFGGAFDLGYGLAVQKDGKLVIAGISGNGTNYAMATVRFWGFPPQESWRLGYFGVTTNTGNAADALDYDLDGLPNLTEYAFGLDPTLGSSVLLPVPQITGGNLTGNFTAPPGVTGITYSAEWSTTLAANDWHAITDTGTGSQHLFSVPVGSLGYKFLRWAVTAP